MITRPATGLRPAVLAGTLLAEGVALHPNDVGYQAMADAINVVLFRH